MKLVACDIGGTNARFAIAEVAGGRVRSLSAPTTLKTADHASLETAWEAFADRHGGDVPRAAAIAIASPIHGEVIKLTNNPWIIRPALIPERLHVDQWMLVNDFGAVAHAVAQLPDEDFVHLCGPDTPLPASGMISICGPGTGLGVAAVHRLSDGYHVIETEGGHQDFAPIDQIEDTLLKRLRASFTRVSAERIVSGPGIVALYETLAEIEGRPIERLDDRTIWARALAGGDSLASAALDRFCLALGTFAGDLALAQGASGLVIAGGLGLRLKDRLLQSGFGQRFTAKGRFVRMMAEMPVKLIVHPEPGLYGAAAAFARAHPEAN